MANHRGDRRAVTRPRSADGRGSGHHTSGGAHSAHPAGHRSLPPGIPFATALAGAATLVLAAAGAVTAAPSGSGHLMAEDVSTPSVKRPSPPAPPAVARASVALDRRDRAVSRDSQRDARADAADQRLQAAAERQATKRQAVLVALASDAKRHAKRQAEERAKERAEERAEEIANAWQLPLVRGVYHLTSRFGECSALWSNCHTGLDFAAPAGQPIRAVARGAVTETGYAGAYGNRTIVRLEGGTEIWYCHQTSIFVSNGQTVGAGQVIGTVGSTGNTTGAHLHLEVRPGDGDPVDPYSALAARGIAP